MSNVSGGWWATLRDTLNNAIGVLANPLRTAQVGTADVNIVGGGAAVTSAAQDPAFVAPGAATPSKLAEIGGIVQVALPSPQLDTKAVQLACDEYGRPKVTGPSLTLASSDATPITTATDTEAIAAPAANHHLRIYYAFYNNGGATPCRVSLMDGAAGAQVFPASLPQYASFAHNFKPGYWDLTSATALYIKTSAAGSIDWTVEYEIVAD